jgi:hypothetical protein
VTNTSGLYSQEENFTYCQKVPGWEDFIIDSFPDVDKQNILIVTNRPYLPDRKEFLPNDIAQWRKVSYFLAYCESEKWHLSGVASFSEGINYLDRGGDLLLFIHGHGKTFPSALVRASQINVRYGTNTILFDWPSFNSNFNKSLARVRRCGDNFYNLLLQLQDYKTNVMLPDQKLNIFAHSLGNYFLTHLVVNGNNQYLKNIFIENMIMNAAAVKARNHDKVLTQLEFQKQIYVISNRNDRVLRGAHLIMNGKMLGNYILPPLAGNTVYVHFAGVAQKEHTFFAGYHKFEYDHPAIFNLYRAILHGEKIDLDMNPYFSLRPEGDGYDLLPLQNSNK